MTATGTVYALIDPRDDQIKYIGQTKQRPAVRVRGKYAPRVLAWLAELRAASLAPRIIAVREDVPADDLLAAEREEITRILVAGGTLLNESATADGREMLRRRREEERITAEQAAWRELAGIALDMLGGPLPPGELPDVGVPDVTWLYMSTTEEERRERLQPLLRAVNPQNVEAEENRYRTWLGLNQAQEEAARKLQWHVHGAWGNACQRGGDRFTDDLDHNVSVIAKTPCASQAEISRHLALTVWYMVAVHPWRHLAELGGLAADDTAFIAWAGQDPEVREAMEFLADRRQRALERLPHRYYGPHEHGPGHTLAVVTAAYSGTAPEAARSHITQVLRKIADDHELTQPMADLLLRLDPEALDSVFGRDIAAEIDRDLGFTAGVSGRVLQALAERIGHINNGPVRRAIDRSAQTLPVVPVPDYGGWSGPGVLAARAISASLVRAGLAEPGRMTPAEYLADVSALWTPDLERLARLAA